MKWIETIPPKLSATSTANHTPIPLKSKGRQMIAGTKNKNVLEKDNSADVLPSESAVKKAEAKILIPISKKAAL